MNRHLERQLVFFFSIGNQIGKDLVKVASKFMLMSKHFAALQEIFFTNLLFLMAEILRYLGLFFQNLMNYPLVN